MHNLDLTTTHTDDLIAELKNRTYDCVVIAITREDLEEYCSSPSSNQTPAFVSPIAWNKDVAKAFRNWEDNNSNDLFIALKEAWQDSPNKIDPELNS